jgi:hypothetical protein
VSLAIVVSSSVSCPVDVCSSTGRPEMEYFLGAVGFAEDDHIAFGFGGRRFNCEYHYYIY